MTPVLTRPTLGSAGMTLGYDFQRYNMLYNTEGPLSAASAKGGTPALTDGTGSDGFSDWFVFPATPTATQFAYFPYPGLLANSTYNMSVFVRMDDGSAPRPGIQTDATADFTLVLQGLTFTAGQALVQDCGGGLYRVYGALSIGTINLPNNNGVVRFTTQSGKGFKVTGYQLTYGAPLLAYEYLGTGQPVIDRSGNGRTNTMGTTTTGTYVDSADPLIVPQGLKFDGTSQFATILNAPASTGQETFTMSVPATPASGVATMYSQAVQAATAHFWFYRLTTGQVMFQWGDGVAFRTSTGMTVNTGDIVTWVIDYTALTYRGFVNGKPTLTGSLTSGALLPATGSAIIGKYVGAASNYASGTFSAVYRWSRLKSDGEVARDYRALKQSLGRRGVLLP